MVLIIKIFIKLKQANAIQFAKIVV